MPTSKPCILVVDDDREMVRLVRGDLERGGYEVLATFDGSSALQPSARSDDSAWFQVTYQDQTGWVSADYLDLTGRCSALPVSSLS